MSVIGVAGQCLGMQGELAALGAMQRGGNRYFDAKLVRRVRLALADAFDLRSMQAIDLAAALITVLLEHLGGQVQRPEEGRLKVVFTGDLSADVADGAPQIGLELAQRLVGALELLGVGVSLMLDQSQLAHVYRTGGDRAPPAWPAAPESHGPG